MSTQEQFAALGQQAAAGSDPPSHLEQAGLHNAKIFDLR